MQQPDPSASVNSNPNMAQPNNNFASNSALMGPSSNNNAQSTQNSNKNFNKDASNGANTKPGRAPRSALSGSGGFGGGGGGSGGQLASGGGRRSGGRRGGGGGGAHGGGGGAKQRQDADQHASFRNYKNNFQPKQHQATSAIAPADEFEAGSVFHPGSKKQNLNHLLNFQFERRGQKQGGQNHQGNRAYGNQRKRAQDYVAKPKYIKEQYLQANCQFAVRSGPDYSHHLSDPDLLVDWDLVEQVVLKTSAKVPDCPICLDSPSAAKITRCGHVYCWTCMLHYLSLSDDDHRKCPICFEEVANKDLKSVVSVPMGEFKMGDEIELTLMRRERNSLFALPVDEYFPDVNAKHPNIGESPNNFSQLVTADPQQVSNMILSREKADLMGLLKELRDDPTVCYVEQALQMLAERESSLALHAINIDQVRPDIPEGANIEEHPEFDPVPAPKGPAAEPESTGAGASSADLRRESSSSEGSLAEQQGGQEEEGDETMVTAKDLDFSAAASDDNQAAKAVGGTKSKLRAPKETFYFYQCSDGQPIFLHAMNVEMLIAEHGSFEACPKKIRGKILERDSASMTLDLRNKLRYMAHIPVTCAFEVAEIDLQVSKEVRAKFLPQLEARRMRRAKRARDERRREKRIQVVENKIMGKYTGPKRNLHLESEVHFPGIGGAEDDDQRQRGFSESGALSAASDNPVDYPAMAPPTPAAGASSFARMLSQGKARPSQARMMTRSETFPRPAVRRASESDPEDYVPPPPSQSIGDALASALASVDLTASGGGGGKKKGKKVKGKKIDLFSSARPML